MADINISNRQPQTAATRPTPPAARPAGNAPAPTSAPTDQVTLSDAARSAQADSQPKAEPAPEKKGFWRGVLDFFVEGEKAKLRQGMQQDAVRMGLDPNCIGPDLNWRQSPAK